MAAIALAASGESIHAATALTHTHIYTCTHTHMYTRADRCIQTRARCELIGWREPLRGERRCPGCRVSGFPAFSGAAQFGLGPLFATWGLSLCWAAESSVAGFSSGTGVRDGGLGFHV